MYIIVLGKNIQHRKKVINARKKSPIVRLYSTVQRVEEAEIMFKMFLKIARVRVYN